MDTSRLRKFAQFARRRLMEEVAAKLTQVLVSDSAARRESGEAVLKLEEQINEHGKKLVIERVAYTWFNRFCALRFMDVNRYTRIGVVSPAEGQFQPEILAEAKMGHIDEETVPQPLRKKIFALLDGSAPSPDAQTEAYRLLVVAACNGYYRAMPYLFERIDDYTELLMPDDLLSGNSILAYTREAMTPDACEDVEVLGWLYQFYISEKKDEVINRRSVVAKEEIPAATQLFTPHWIVRYLVQNSLGRLWMLNRPKSRLVEQMEYYIQAEQTEVNFLQISKPEDLKICDPACGSGHILVYAFDLLYAIYEEEGYEASEIPEKILTHNLYGIEIDERAGILAAFALTMKARAEQRRFFRKPVQPHICILENVQFADSELKDYMDFIGRDLFTTPLLSTLHQFKEADNFGSLIRPEVSDVENVLRMLEEKDVGGQLLLYQTHQKVLKVLQQANYLSPKYHVVVANPPYMGGRGMNNRLKAFLQDDYKDVKADLFSAFMVRIIELSLPKAELGFVTPYVWMFISSYEKLRNILLQKTTITSLIQLEYNAFAPACIPVATFTVTNQRLLDFKGSYIKLSDFRGAENQPIKALEAIANPDCGWFYRASSEKFNVIPGSPIAYWVSDKFVAPFKKAKKFVRDLTISDGQTKTGDNDKYLRQHWEISLTNVGLDRKWWQHPKGGSYRKWYGNVDWVIDWSEEARNHYRKDHVARILPEYLWGRRGISWTLITSGNASFRLLEPNQIFNLAAPSLFFHEEQDIEKCLGFLNTKYVAKLLNVINPTLNMNVGEVRCLPLLSSIDSRIDEINQVVKECISIAKTDWDAYETSLDFTTLPLFRIDHCQTPLKSIYATLCAYWQKITVDMKRLEEQNNRIFIETYGLEDELTPEVPLSEITLTCNPYYRYGSDKPKDEVEALLLADTMREFISYAVGCMVGRYSLDKPGLILANQGETIEDYHQQIPNPTFPADTDNVIPMLDGDWFPDDISERFRKFLRVTFGEENYDANLKFIEKALGKDIRRYFLRDFYNDHIRRYKKRPIYWLFSSPKGTFNALIYMHRYRPDTVSVVLNDYLREFRTKLVAHRNHLEQVSISTAASAAEKTKALKEIEALRKAIDELESYEREVLYPLATERVEIDLDDGVRINYGKFGTALKKIPGLEAVED
ncbi:MAG: BREX-1 system adenine-specific DNA-methyltransferase PglX [Actinomycetota bacterium]